MVDRDSSATGVVDEAVSASEAVSVRDRHFRTDHLMSDLKGRTVRGGAVTVTAQGCKFTLMMCSNIVLARLLTPADFGLIAMVAAFTGFVILFQDLGLSIATVQRAQITHAQVSTLFWINVALSLLLTLIGISIAPAIAWLYGEPELVWITMAIACTFVFGGLAAQHTALLRRQMKFKSLAIIEVFAQGFGIALAIVLAWYGAGYWALVALLAGQWLMNAVLAWGLSGWMPSLPSRRSGVRPMLNFGANVSGFNLLTYIGRNADNVLIGAVLGASVTGLYSRAYGLLMLPLTQINTPLNSVALPALSRLQDDPARYATYYYRALKIIAYLTGPLIVLLAATATELIPLMLGEQWVGAAPIFQILAVAAIFQPILYTAGWIWLSLGRTREMFRWSMLTAPCFVASFAIGLPWGAEGVALAYAICVNALTPVALIWAYRGTHLRLGTAINTVATPYALSAMMLVTALAMRPLFAGWPLFVIVCCTGMLAVAVGGVLILTSSRMRRDIVEVMELWKVLRDRKS